MPANSRARAVALIASFLAASLARAQEPLPSWNDGPAKRAILDFVTCAVTDGCTGYIPPEDRIATFDNDGTLWVEQPLYAQLVFAMDRVKALAPQHPEWATQEPFKSLLAGDVKAALAGGEKSAAAILGPSHAGMTVQEFNATVRDWLKTAKHPRFNRPYNECVYQPMLEVLAYLRANDFKTFIVSGGGAEFMRVWADAAYGIPPEQVVGSTGKLRYELHNGTPALLKLPEIQLVDDGPGKPVGIAEFIAHRPVIAFGNSDGDYEMLEYTTVNGSDAGHPLPRLGLIVHHTDAEREYAYDRDSPIGRLARGLNAAAEQGWVLIDMKNDWKTIFPPQRDP
jgi:phosphoglycolate phosphatase-like HAD superfamily hydrolase